jgi:hypothetical protein
MRLTNLTRAHVLCNFSRSRRQKWNKKILSYSSRKAMIVVETLECEETRESQLEFTSQVVTTSEIALFSEKKRSTACEMKERSLGAHLCVRRLIGRWVMWFIFNMLLTFVNTSCYIVVGTIIFQSLRCCCTCRQSLLILRTAEMRND